MTNALAQNIETNKVNSADLLMQAVSVSNDINTQEVSNSKFSNLMNNVEARTQKAQKNFQEQAKVTNTSSINKKALERKEAIDNSQVADKKIIKDNKKVYEKPLQPKEPIKAETITKQDKTTISENEINVVENDIQTVQTKEVSQTENNKITENSENLSDINNSSPVDTSPVFSSDNTEASTTTQEVVEIPIENMVVIAPIVDTVDTTNIQNAFDKLKETIDEIENIETVEQLKTTVEEISSTLDNLNLTKEQKDEIIATVDKLKEILNSASDKLAESADFSELLGELKIKAQDLLEGVMLKLTDKISQVSSKAVDVELDVVSQEDVANIQKQSQVLDTQKIDTETLQEVKEIIDVIAKDLEAAAEKFDIEKISDIQEKLPEITKEINSLMSGNETNEDSIELNKKLVEALKSLEEMLSQTKVSTNQTETKTIDLTQVKTALDEINSLIKNVQKIENTNENIVKVDFAKDGKVNIIDTLDKLNSIDLAKLDNNDKKALEDVLTILDNLNSELDVQEIDEQTKVEIENLVKQVSNNELSIDEISQAIDDLTDEIKTQLDSKVETVIVQDSENIIKVEDFSNQNNSTFDKNQENTQEFELKLTEDSPIDFENVQDFDVDLNEVNLKGKVSSNIDLKNVEENIQKQVYTQEIMEDMLVEVNVKTIPAQSGALSVADEVAKLAMGEQNSLNSATSSSSVTYDNTGVNAIIKNAAQQIKSAQPQGTQNPSMEEVLNQVTNKITQLKDTTGQKLTMVLRPNDLGRLSIELTSNNQGLTTHIVAQNEDVRAYIEKNINSLRQQLSEAGVNVNNIQIKTAGQEGSTNYEGNQNFNKGQDENLNQQNNKDNNNQQQNHNRNSKETLNAFSNYDNHFAKDFSSVLNKSLSYGLN